MAPSATTNNRIVWAVRLLLALAFGAAGAAKLAGDRLRPIGGVLARAGATR